jgi:hypothetical protein
MCREPVQPLRRRKISRSTYNVEEQLVLGRAKVGLTFVVGSVVVFFENPLLV